MQETSEDERRLLENDLHTIRGKDGTVIDHYEVQRFLTWYDLPTIANWQHILWVIIIPPTKTSPDGTTLQKACCIMNRAFEQETHESRKHEKSGPMPDKKIFKDAISYATH